MQMADILGATSVCVFNNVAKTVKPDYRCAYLKEVKQVLECLLP